MFKSMKTKTGHILVTKYYKKCRCYDNGKITKDNRIIRGYKKMKLIDNIKKIETYICENFQELDLDDPMEEEYFQEYESIDGASEHDLLKFEEAFSIHLPKDFKTLYQYKNGSKFMCILPSMIRTSDMCFCLMSLEEIKKCKTYFQNKNALLSDFPEYFSPQDIDNMRDNRIKPYLFNKRWIPFAQYCETVALMLRGGR